MNPRHIIPLCILSLTTLTCNRVGTALNKIEIARAKLVSLPPLTQLDTLRLNLITLGHKGLYDDLATIWSVQFLADPDLTRKSTADELFNVMMQISKHQTKIEALYLLSCFVLANDFKRPDLCTPLLKNVVSTFPKSWRLPLTQAFMYSFYLKDTANATAYFQLAASIDGAPEHVKSLAKKMQAKQAADGRDLNDTLDLLKDVPGGTRVIELIRQRFEHLESESLESPSMESPKVEESPRVAP